MDAIWLVVELDVMDAMDAMLDVIDAMDAMDAILLVVELFGGLGFRVYFSHSGPRLFQHAGARAC
jgi:hypothetical protein